MSSNKGRKGATAKPRLSTASLENMSSLEVAATITRARRRRDQGRRRLGSIFEQSSAAAEAPEDEQAGDMSGHPDEQVPAHVAAITVPREADERMDKEGDLEFGDVTLRAATRILMSRGFTTHSTTLTWQDLTVQCADTHVTLLKATTGAVVSGEMTALLGEPASVRALMAALTRRHELERVVSRNANARRKRKGQPLMDHSDEGGTWHAAGALRVRGQLLLNGHEPHRRRGGFWQRHVAFVPPEDTHLPTLTVRETMRFACRMRAPAHMTDEACEREVDTALGCLPPVCSRLGLSHVADELVGGSTCVRGISGGQRRRLSFGVEVVGGAGILVAELPTNGLDSRTALDQPL
ncbi:MAG: hypothetical protein MHM6MM_006665 [Cercozoa sp. M6MM]